MQRGGGWEGRRMGGVVVGQSYGTREPALQRTSLAAQPGANQKPWFTDMDVNIYLPW